MLGFRFTLDQSTIKQSSSSIDISIFVILNIHMFFVNFIKLRTFEFLLVFFVSHAGIGLFGETNRI